MLRGGHRFQIAHKPAYHAQVDPVSYGAVVANLPLGFQRVEQLGLHHSPPMLMKRYNYHLLIHEISLGSNAAYQKSSLGRISLVVPVEPSSMTIVSLEKSTSRTRWRISEIVSLSLQTDIMIESFKATPN